MQGQSSFIDSYLWDNMPASQKSSFECNLQDSPDVALNRLCFQKHIPDNFPFKWVYSWGQVLIFELLHGNLDLLLFPTPSSLFMVEDSNSQDRTNSPRIFKNQDLTPCYYRFTPLWPYLGYKRPKTVSGLPFC